MNFEILSFQLIYNLWWYIIYDDLFIFETQMKIFFNDIWEISVPLLKIYSPKLWRFKTFIKRFK